MSAVALKFELWPKQLEALQSEGTERLFGGASEGGKSHLARVEICSWALVIPNLQCVLIRKKISDILANHVEGPSGFRQLLKPLVDMKAVIITKEGIKFPRGSICRFVHCQDERQFDSAQGIETQLLVVDEATQIPERLIRIFRAWVRMTDEQKLAIPEQYRHLFPRILYTANPVGVSVPFFKRHFIKARPMNVIEEVEGFKRQFIKSLAADNKSINLQIHKNRLDGLNDPALAKALDEGDWDSPIGEFYVNYDDAIHTIPDIRPAEHWFKFITFDWGSSDLGAVVWWAVVGEEGLQLTNRYLPPGALIGYREWHICAEDDVTKGAELGNEQMARLIRARTLEQTSGLVITDALPFSNRGTRRYGQPYTIADEFAGAGLPLTRGNLNRVYGCKQVKDRLSGQDGIPMLYFCQSCVHARDYLPAIGRDPKNPEAAAESGEASHMADVVRYACAAKPLTEREPVDASRIERPGPPTVAKVIDMVLRRNRQRRR